MNRNLSPPMLTRVEEWVDASSSERDELYAAANTLDDNRRSNVRRQLGDHLPCHAMMLQQLLAVDGEATQPPLDMYAIAEGFFKLAKIRDGEAEVLRNAENCEQTVKEHFDEVLAVKLRNDTAAILIQQRDDIEFCEQVLHSMQKTPQSDRRLSRN